MVRRPPAKGTLIERIYREVNGEKMPEAVKRILLKIPRPKIKPKPWN
jgi:hypothetical protein